MAWTNFTDCSVTCGNGTVSRRRSCVEWTVGGTPCTKVDLTNITAGNETDVKQCTKAVCIIGEFSLS